jgi:putative DNA-invertase from lambdoid prophage Rac
VRVIALIGLRDNLHVSTPPGPLMLQTIGAMAEFERALIAERIRAGLRNARAKGKRLGRPPVAVDVAKVRELWAAGTSWPAIAKQLGVSVGTAYAVGNSRTAPQGV